MLRQGVRFVALSVLSMPTVSITQSCSCFETRWAEEEVAEEEVAEEEVAEEEVAEEEVAGGNSTGGGGILNACVLFCVIMVLKTSSTEKS